jgi:fibronectin type 3 domain-containing protein
MINTKLKLISIFTISTLIFGGCSSSLNSVTKPKVDNTLPKVDENIATLIDTTTIAFEWKSIRDSRVNGYTIYRSSAKEPSKLTQLVKVDSRYSTHFTDEKLEPNTTYNYRFSTFDKKDFESHPTKTITVTTKPRIKPVSFIQAISNLPRVVKVIWRPHVNDKVIGYKVYRLQYTDNKWKEIEELDGRLKAEYIDEDLKDNTTYSYKIVAKTIDKVNSQQSKIVTAKTKPLPLPTQNLKATLNKPKVIELSWDKSLNKDIEYYNIYSSSSQNGSFSKIDQVNETNFSHKIGKDGVTKFYKIRAMDKDQLEAHENQMVIMGRTLPVPMTPILTTVTIQDKKAIVKWTKTDNRAVSFNIIKKESKGWNNTKTGLIKNIKGEEFIDEHIIAGVEYEYSIQSVDKYGILSKPSAKSKVFLPKIEKQKR